MTRTAEEMREAVLDARRDAEVSSAPRRAYGSARTLTVRAMRAAPRVVLSQAHLEQLFGAGHRLTVASPGLLGEPLHLERVTLSAGPRREVKVRVCASPSPVTRIHLPQSALTTLDIRNAPARGHGEGAGVALSGPKGALVIPDGVFRAGVRLVLPVGVARKLGVAENTVAEVSLPASGETLDPALYVEVRPNVVESWLVLDSPHWERIMDPTAPVVVRLGPPSAPPGS
ncbi:MAG: hypothetical protein AB2A00_10020 [Myxococcota bacterium]